MKISVSVEINAPLAEAWDAYVSPDDINQWNFASDDWQCSDARVDLRLGGSFSSHMEAKDGSQREGWQAILNNYAKYVLTH